MDKVIVFEGAINLDREVTDEDVIWWSEKVNRLAHGYYADLSTGKISSIEDYKTKGQLREENQRLRGALDEIRMTAFRRGNLATYYKIAMQALEGRE